MIEPTVGQIGDGSPGTWFTARREQPSNKAMKSDVEKRGSNFRCTVLALTFSGSAESAALFNAAYR
jgi:hypothetical protein